WHHSSRPARAGSRPTSTRPPGTPGRPCRTINPQHPHTGPIRRPPG
ncbi:MAG: hypothetical protein AVDCRST_MAG66-2947, partial [uncultured Pseudonocardia sp.]